MTPTVSPGLATPAAPATRNTWPLTAAVMLAAAGALHLAAAADHREGPDRVVLFFLVVAFGQAGAAVWFTVAAVTRQRPGLLPVALAAVATVGLLLLYLTAYTTDLVADLSSSSGSSSSSSGGHGGQGASPGSHAATSGSEAGEPAGWLGSVTVSVEVVLLLALTAMLPPRARRLAANGILAVGMSAWALWLFGLPG